MKSAVTTVEPMVAPLLRGRIADYAELTKPKIAVLVLCTVAAGFCLASQGTPELIPLLHTLFGTALVAAGASVLNQYLERNIDGLMQRTENRPLPAGRLQPGEVLLLGLSLGVGGLAYLLVLLPNPLCVVVAAFTFACYVWIYTPLKRHTTLNTLVGAVPGALPPVIGWTAAGGALNNEALFLFLVLFLWQVPHFLAIAWMYRDDYARADLKMLPVVDPTGAITGRQMVAYCGCLLMVSILPVLWGWAGIAYFAAAAAAGGAFLLTTWRFLRQPSVVHARMVLKGSLLYLPSIMALILVCRIHGL